MWHGAACSAAPRSTAVPTHLRVPFHALRFTWKCHCHLLPATLRLHLLRGTGPDKNEGNLSTPQPPHDSQPTPTEPFRTGRSDTSDKEWGLLIGQKQVAPPNRS
mmetsp:Transcript_148581/g.259685  ORF Transcript_148581/g.259685 Transcript_148581/m.259685 type:complete len:104 (+) Transcript_148581:331-642(+)